MAEPDFRSYYGRPVLKEPVWKPEIPWYFFLGGIGGASAGLSLGAQIVGNERLARNAQLISLGALALSPVLLIKDLGRPERFYNMMRVFKVTSPMSVGTWLLSAQGSLTAVAAAAELLGVLPRGRRLAQTASGLLGLGVSTYTGALVADTAIPVWHDARRELPFVFAGGAAATAGAAAAVLTPAELAGPARRLALTGAALELGATKLMEDRLGTLVGEPYRRGTSGSYARLAKGLTAAGALVLAAAGRRRAGAMAGAALVLAGGAFGRWAVFKAGFASARDPKYTVVPQRKRLGEHAAT